jgi:ATP/maltotriose-dependent transcriptional regulator MalT
MTTPRPPGRPVGGRGARPNGRWRPERGRDTLDARPSSRMETSDRQALPPLFPRHVRRPRLTRLLDETKAQVIVLTAPAGYGKTTLAAEWLQQRENVAWYRATEASADVAAFAADLAKSMDHVTSIGRRLEQTLKVAQVPSDPGRRLAELLAEDARGWPEDALLVLDDFHLAATRTVNRFIDWLISLSSLKLVVTTRRHPPWLTARRATWSGSTAR